MHFKIRYTENESRKCNQIKCTENEYRLLKFNIALLK